MAQNPFLDSSFEISWSRLTPELVEPAVREALGRAQAAVDAIAAARGSVPSYENTFRALEKATEELGLVWGKVSHLQSVADSAALRDAYNAVLPDVTTFFTRIPLNVPLWERLKAFAESPALAALKPVERRHVEETVADFVQAGANLPEDKRRRLEQLENELAQVTQKYSENVLDATNAWQLLIDDPQLLGGLPERAKQAALRSAQAKGYAKEGKPAWRFTLQMPSLEPVMSYAEREELRRWVWQGSADIGALVPFDNMPLIRKILALRSEKAALLGKDNFANLVLERRMARSGQKALSFIDEVRERALVKFRQDCEDLEEYRATKLGAGRERLKAWELGYWSEKLRRERYAFDEEALRPYFPMDRVVSGLFEICGRIFGIKVQERAPGTVEVWHPEVKFYDVTNEQGERLGSFYADWHPRESKRGGAWMNYLITGGPQPDGRRLPHLGLICGNLTPPAEGRPALLTHREVETIFHEFGHLLHHLLGNVEVKSLNGTNVAWDFVELPSQILENWCWERESLDLFARHHESGAAIPEELFQAMTRARNFRSASATMRQVQFAKMDLLFHLRSGEFGGADMEARLLEALADTLIPTLPAPKLIMRRFTHIFADSVGYAAGYYSYKWAEVLDADAFTRFKQEGIFNRTTGAQFVDCILSKGNSEDPALLFRRFMGRDPDPRALLVRAGLA